MRELPTRLAGLRLFELELHADDRGTFVETWQKDRWGAAGITDRWVQENESASHRGVLRGMHFQIGEGQTKLVRVAAGRAFDVAVDVRHGSPTLGQWESFELSPNPPLALYIPVGFAHGFYALKDGAYVVYKVSGVYDPSAERGLAWNDPEVAIRWPSTEPIVSARDSKLPSLRELRNAGELL